MLLMLLVRVALSLALMGACARVVLQTLRAARSEEREHKLKRRPLKRPAPPCSSWDRIKVWAVFRRERCEVLSELQDHLVLLRLGGYRGAAPREPSPSCSDVRFLAHCVHRAIHRASASASAPRSPAALERFLVSWMKNTKLRSCFLEAE